MSEITKQYFDKALKNLATKQDIKGLDVKIDKLDFKIENEVAELAAMVSRRFDEVEKRLDIRTEVENLNHRMSRIEQALNLKN